MEEHYDKLHGRPMEQVVLEFFILIAISTLCFIVTLWCVCYKFWRDYCRMISAAFEYRRLNSLKRMEDGDNIEKSESDHFKLDTEYYERKKPITTSDTVETWVDQCKIYHL